MVMNRRTALALLAALPLARPAFAQPSEQVLVEVSKYLNQLTSVTGRFTQINADGSRSAGVYYLRRPGRIRFEYDGDQALVIADGTYIGVMDAKSNVEPQRYFLKQTPLRFLLREQIDLTRENLARDTDSANGFTQVVLQDPKAPADGSMTLTLRNTPPTLTQWTVREKSGQATTVILESMEQAGDVDARLFNIDYNARLFQRG